MAEKSITKSLISNIPGVSPELMKGDIAGHVTRSPGSTAASLLKFGTGIGMFTPAGLALGAIGSGIDSYNQSMQADKDLQATGIQATGPMGQDWTTSAVRDFLPSFLGGQEAEDQARDIEEEVAELRRKWYELDADDAEANSFQAAYTMGGATFAIAETQADNIAYAQADDKDTTTISMSLAF